jgi:NCAIR mutase (PurE)-related protein
MQVSFYLNGTCHRCVTLSLVQITFHRSSTDKLSDQPTARYNRKVQGDKPKDQENILSEASEHRQAQFRETSEDQVEQFATLDFDRAERCGFPEVVFGSGKTPDQVATIMARLVEKHGVVLCTRASALQAEAARALLPDAGYVASCGFLYVDRREPPLRVSGDEAAAILAKTGAEGADSTPSKRGATNPTGENTGDLSGEVLVCCAGTSDLPVAEEAALTARLMGSRVRLLTDIGLAGVHRALEHVDELRSARVIVAVAGMEGALPSLVAGLVKVPVVAVPTSVGYGANFGGLAALLGMLNSCASGVSVVNIDNGFGAGVIAHRINAPEWLPQEGLAQQAHPQAGLPPAGALQEALPREDAK